MVTISPMSTFRPLAISNPASFYDEARCQVVCAVCGDPGEFEAHHVISKQRLKRIGLIHRLYDPRNALRLCKRDNRCHMNREHGGVNRVTVPTEKLTDENICFIWETLNVAGQNLLEREYSGIDRRYSRHTEGNCPRCQA